MKDVGDKIVTSRRCHTVQSEVVTGTWLKHVGLCLTYRTSTRPASAGNPAVPKYI